MPSSKTTHEARARHYLKASMSAGYTGLPKEHHDAYQAQMASHERAYSRVREHALAGADKDFDKPLTAGEREHQAHLRSQDGMQHADVERIRRELRGTTPRARTPRRAAASSTRGRASTAAGAATASAAQAVRTAATGGSGGSTLMYAVGAGLFLILVYLLVAGKGTKAVSGIVNSFVGAANAFVKPVDPIAAAESALGVKAAERVNPTEEGPSGARTAYTPSPGGTAAEKAEVQAISKANGWDATAWESVIEDESGWNPNATNATSGAYGIGQFLGATKTEYAPEGATSSNPIEQIKAMGDYIKNRYHNPTAALAHETSDHWY